jgi:two-component system osmolarity sensor histidine kinase EnvZ
MARDVQELADNRTTMLTGISHDLRTPLARLRLAIEMLGPNADPTLITGIERDIAVMDRLIGQYLDLARDLNAETPERLDIRELVDEAVGDARRAGATVTWQPPAQSCPAIVRASALQRILGNLLDNARRYGGDTPIEVICERDASKLAIAVLDRGPGIPVSEGEAVFRPFYRVESSRSGATGGAGLGLAVARQLSEWNGWKLALAPREGGGTEARLTIPN